MDGFDWGGNINLNIGSDKKYASAGIRDCVVSASKDGVRIQYSSSYVDISWDGWDKIVNALKLIQENTKLG